MDDSCMHLKIVLKYFSSRKAHQTFLGNRLRMVKKLELEYKCLHKTRSFGNSDVYYYVKVKLRISNRKKYFEEV